MTSTISKTGITFSDGSVQTSAGYTAFRNKIRNSAMLIDQRGTATTAITAGGSTVAATACTLGTRYVIASPGTTTWPYNSLAGYPFIRTHSISLTGTGTTYAAPYTLDGWFAVGMGTGITSIQQVSDAPAGFSKSLKATVTTSVAIGSSNAYAIGQTIEGYELIEANAQTSGALLPPIKSFSLSFWVKASIAGTYSVAVSTNVSNNGMIYDGASNICISKNYTVATPGVWQRVTIQNIQFPDELTAYYAASVGLTIQFCLGVGSSFSQAANTWGVNLAYGSTSQNTSFMSTVGNTFQITGAQFEFGPVSTPYEVLDYAQEIKRNQRFFMKFFGTSAFERAPGIGVFSTTAQGFFVLNLPTQMSSSNGSTSTIYPSGAMFTSSGGGTYNISTLSMITNNVVQVITSQTAVAGQQFIIMANNSTAASITLTSEL